MNHEPSMGEVFIVIKKYVEDTFNRVELAYWWFSENYGGQGSASYESLCKLSKIYRPGYMQRGPEDQGIYQIICKELL